MLGRVIQDDGYVITLIRPIREAAVRVGTKMECKPMRDPVDLTKLFDLLISTEEETLRKFKSQIENEILQRSQTTK